MIVARPRRARRRSLAPLLIIVPLLLLLLAALLVPGLREVTETVSSPTPRASSPVPTSPRATVGSASKSPQPGPDASKAPAALRECRAKVAAADQVLIEAKDGMQSWSDHLQAQTDFNDGKIDQEEMDDIFDKTRNDGNSDVERYRSAVDRHDSLHGSCGVVPGAPAEIAEGLSRCAQRSRAQQPVLAAADAGMTDWRVHLADMAKSDKGKIHNPQAKWIRTWRAAPKNINAYNKAVQEFSAPRC